MSSLMLDSKKNPLNQPISAPAPTYQAPQYQYTPAINPNTQINPFYMHEQNVNSLAPMQMYQQYKQMANMGRNGDTELVHMRPDEVQALGLLAQATGTNLTTNPATGNAEAFSLPSWLLPVAAIAATVLTAGAAAPAAAGALGAAGAGTAAGAAGAAGAGALGAGAAGAAGTGAALGAGTTGGLLGSTSLGGSLVGSGALAEGAAAGSALGGSTLGGSMVGTGALEGAGAAGLTEGATAGGLLAGEQAAAPVVNMNTEAGLFDTMNYKSGGLLGNATDAYSKYGKPAGQVMNAARLGQEMAQAQEPAPIQPPQMKSVPLDLSSILNQSQALQQYDLQERLRKRQMLNQYSSNIGRV